MNFIILVIVGGVIGWVASLIMRRFAQQDIFLNLVVGAVGSLLSGVLITPLLGEASITSGEIAVVTILVSLLGAITLLTLVNLVRRGNNQ
jgi:uncharacterized membrane protein YeaQ/YmgE (transglycosylase-associated protein family)